MLTDIMQNIRTLGKTSYLYKRMADSQDFSDPCKYLRCKSVRKKGLQGSNTQCHLTHDNLYIQPTTEAVNVY